MTININDLDLTSENIEFLAGKESHISEFFGTFTLTKGSFKQEFSYYAKLNQHEIPGFLIIEDWDCSTLNTNIGTIKIDDLSKFKKMLLDSGLESLNHKLAFTSTNREEAICKAIEKQYVFKILYHPGFRIYNSLSKKEREYVNLKWTIQTYNERSEFEKNQFFKDATGTTIEQLAAYYNNYDEMYYEKD